MKTYSRLTLSFLLLILVLPQVGAGPASEWEKAYAKAQSLNKEGKYKEAISK